MDGPLEGRSRRRVRENLTHRQMEILALIAQGRTNAEIAEHFEISLSGAKYHVSEILSVLHVGTREEAAAWWRRERGLASRLRRLSSALMSMDLVRGVTAAGAVGGVGAVGVLVVLAFATGGGKIPAVGSQDESFEPIAACPVSEAICAFAEKAQAAVQQGDVDGIVSGSTWAGAGNDPAGVGQSIDIVLRPQLGTPVLTSIGCPILDDKPDCDRAFSLAFTAASLALNGDDGILLFGFEAVDDGEPVLTAMAVPDQADREIASSGGTTNGCFASGLTTRRFEGECIRTEFLRVQ